VKEELKKKKREEEKEHHVIVQYRFKYNSVEINTNVKKEEIQKHNYRR
jgi:hypothetical protein